jgi:putative restriction endonuclease
MARYGEDWSHDELILAFSLYSEIPFGKIHMGNIQVQELSKLLGRTPGSVSMKLSNFARLDPALQARGIVGLQRGGKGEERIWDEFKQSPEAFAFTSQKLLAERVGRPVEEVARIETDDLPAAGLEREALVRVRVNQSFFRKRILSAYEFRCCVTGLRFPELLVASHIVPWSEDSANRLNPRNGLCLNALHDRAFDRHLMWIDPEFRIRFARRLSGQNSEEKGSLDWLLSYEGKQLRLPKHFAPDPRLLSQHARKQRVPSEEPPLFGSTIAV